MWDSTLTLSNVSLNVIKKCIQVCCYCYLIMSCKIITPLILFFLGSVSLSPLCSSSLHLCIFQLWSKKFSMFWRCETPFSFLEMWAIKINPAILKPCGNGVALPGFCDSRASAAWGFLCLHASQGVKHLNRVIPPFQSHGAGMGDISKQPTLADRSVLSCTIT